MRRPIIVSSIVHALVLISIFLVPGLRIPFFDRPMKIDVMWMELPKGTGEEIDMGLKKADALPKSTIEEQKQLFQPEPTKQVTAKPEMKAPAPTETKTAKKNEPRPEIDTSKMKIVKPGEKPVARPAVKENRKIRDALAKIDKALTGRQIVPESGQISESGKGYKYGTSDKPLRVSPSDPEYLKYQAMVRAKIIRSWIVPTRYGDEGGSRYNSRLEVMISTDGEVTATRLLKSSGNPSFDQSAVRAVKNSSPFPRPPDRLAWEAYNEGFLIEFDPRLKPQ